jgi:hypothetical protein
MPEAEEVALNGRGPVGEGSDCCRPQTSYWLIWSSNYQYYLRLADRGQGQF